MNIYEDLKEKSKGELAAIVAKIITVLYGEDDKLHPDKEWDSETIEQVAAIIHGAMLAPEEKENPISLESKDYDTHPFTNEELIEIFEIARLALDPEQSLRDEIGMTSDLSDKYLTELHGKLQKVPFDPNNKHDMIEVPVTDIRVGDRVDLESCPYLNKHASAPYEYAEVVMVERETPECIVLGYEGIDNIGYPINQTLRVRLPRPELKDNTTT